MVGMKKFWIHKISRKVCDDLIFDDPDDYIEVEEVKKPQKKKLYAYLEKRIGHLPEMEVTYSYADGLPHKRLPQLDIEIIE